MEVPFILNLETPKEAGPNSVQQTKNCPLLATDSKDLLVYACADSLYSQFVHWICVSFLLFFSTSKESHFGHGLEIGLSHERKSHSGNRSQP